MRNKITLVIILPLLLFTPGCWDLQDANNTAFVLGMGIDTPTNPVTAKYKVTFEFAKPLSAREHPVVQDFVVSMEADSILQAIQRTQASTSRKISLSHLRLVVIGEDMARQNNFKNIINYLMREPNLALRLRLLFVQNAEAREFLNTNPQFEKRVAAEMVAMGMLQKELDLARTNYFLDFITDLKRSKGVALGSRVTIQKDGNEIACNGGAIFQNWRLSAWLNADETQASNWLMQETQSVVVAKDEDNTYTYQVRKKDARFKPFLESGKPSIAVNITTEGMMMEETGKDLDLSKQENTKKLEALFSNVIHQQVKSAINKSQKELKADYIGFDKAFQKYESEAFKTLNWDEVYPSIPIEIEVDCKIKNYGLHK